jgi:hypothetical protein
LLMTILLSSAGRLGVALHVGPTVTPDTFSYLNLARQLRGIEYERGWDPLADLPREDQGARTPLYPLILNALFRTAPIAGTPEGDAQRIFAWRRDAWHEQFLRSAENVRFVQLAQHFLGVIATALAFWILVCWSGNAAVASIGSLVAVGFRPSWLFLYEPAVLSEIWAATGVLAVTALIATREHSSEWHGLWETALGILTALLVLLRPALAPAALLLSLVDLRWRRPALVCARVVPLIVLAGLWSFRNETRWGFFGLSSTLGANLSSHVPDGLSFADAGRESVVPNLAMDRMRHLVQGSNMSFVAASAALGREALHAALHHPVSYLESVSEAFLEGICFSNETILTPRHAGTLWHGLILFYRSLAAAAILILFRRGPRSARILVAIAAASVFSCAVLAHTENGRYGFPFEAVVTLAGITALNSVAVQLAFMRAHRTHPS